MQGAQGRLGLVLFVLCLPTCLSGGAVEVGVDGNVGEVLESDFSVRFNLREKLGLSLSKELQVLKISARPASDARSIVKLGDTIVSVNGVPVRSEAALKSAILQAKGDPLQPKGPSIGFVQGPQWTGGGEKSFLLSAGSNNWRKRMQADGWHSTKWFYMPFGLGKGPKNAIFRFHTGLLPERRYAADYACGLKPGNTLEQAGDAFVRKQGVISKCPAKVVIYYRLSDSATPQAASKQNHRPDYLNDKQCLYNTLRILCGVDEVYTPDLHIIADNVQDATFGWLQSVVSASQKRIAAADGGKCGKQSVVLSRTTYGSGAGSFNHALDLALARDDADIAYFLEDDYLHRPGALTGLREAMAEAEYVSLYDHPDNFFGTGCLNKRDAQVQGGHRNFRDQSGAQISVTKSSYWRSTPYATMTFAATVDQLRRDEKVLRHFSRGRFVEGGGYVYDVDGTTTDDRSMFQNLTAGSARLMLSPVPSFSTHGEIQYLAPLVDWEMLASETGEAWWNSLH